MPYWVQPGTERLSVAHVSGSNNQVRSFHRVVQTPPSRRHQTTIRFLDRIQLFTKLLFKKIIINRWEGVIFQ